MTQLNQTHDTNSKSTSLAVTLVQYMLVAMFVLNVAVGGAVAQTDTQDSDSSFGMGPEELCGSEAGEIFSSIFSILVTLAVLGGATLFALGFMFERSPSDKYDRETRNSGLFMMGAALFVPIVIPLIGEIIGYPVCLGMFGF